MDTPSPPWLAALLAASTAAGAFGRELLAFLAGLVRDRRASDTTLAVAELDDAAKLRKEMWDEIRDLRGRVDRLQAELDTERRARVQLLAEHESLKLDHQRVQEELDELRSRA